MTNSKKQLILNRSLLLFLNYGIKVVSMDDIANKCGISKRTLYKLFDSKSDLLKCIVENKTEEFLLKLSVIHDKSKDAVEELLEYIKLISTVFKSISPITIRDLKKYHIDIYLQVLRLNPNKLRPLINKNMERGINEGLYNKNLFIEAYEKSFVKIIAAYFNSSLEQKKLEEHYQMLDFFFKLFFKGLFTAKGYEKFEKYYV